MGENLEVVEEQVPLERVENQAAVVPKVEAVPRVLLQPKETQVNEDQLENVDSPAQLERKAQLDKPDPLDYLDHRDLLGKLEKEEMKAVQAYEEWLVHRDLRAKEVHLVQKAKREGSAERVSLAPSVSRERLDQSGYLGRQVDLVFKAGQDHLDLQDQPEKVVLRGCVGSQEKKAGLVKMDDQGNKASMVREEIVAIKAQGVQLVRLGSLGHRESVALWACLGFRANGVLQEALEAGVKLVHRVQPETKVNVVPRVNQVNQVTLESLDNRAQRVLLGKMVSKAPLDFLAKEDRRDLEAPSVSQGHQETRAIVDLLDQVDLLEKEETEANQEIQVVQVLRVQLDQRVRPVARASKETEVQLE